MKAISDYITILFFFATWVISRSIYTATLVAMIASSIQWLIMIIIHKQLKAVRFLSINTAFWLIFGSFTLIFHDQRFIQIKPTILYTLFALAFLLSPYFLEKNLYQTIFSGKIDLPKRLWSHLNLSCVVFFIAMALINLLVVYYFSLKFWMYYKIVGTLALTLIFCLTQAYFISRGENE